MQVPFTLYLHNKIRRSSETAPDPSALLARPNKTYPRFPSISLPVSADVSSELSDALNTRKSADAFDPECSLSREQLATLCGLGLKIREDGKRPYPSGGGLYPIETYVIALRVEGIEVGAYHYDPKEHSLEFLVDEVKLPEYVRSMNLSFAKDAAAAFLFTSLWSKNIDKYRDTAYELALFEAGHAMQNIALLCAALDLSIRPLAGIKDAALCDLLDIDEMEESPLYMCLLGKELR